MDFNTNLKDLKAHEVGPEPIVINGVTWGPYKWPKING